MIALAVASIVTFSPMVASADSLDEEITEFASEADGSQIELQAEGLEGGHSFGGGGTAVPIVNEEVAPGAPDAYEHVFPPTRLGCDFLDENAQSDCPEAQIQADAPEEEEAEELDPVDVTALIETAFQTLPLDASPITYQPEGDWAAVNMDFIVHTSDEAQVLDTEILGVPLTFRVSPVHWTWTFGDGSPGVGSSTAGAPYPDHTISHVYTSAADSVTITVDTLWQGEYQIAGGGDWYPVTGYATTTSTAGPVEIVTFDVALVP